MIEAKDADRASRLDSNVATKPNLSTLNLNLDQLQLIIQKSYNDYLTVMENSYPEILEDYPKVARTYPKKGNLQDIIGDLRLHPFTCLISLSNVHKRMLLAKGIILCRDLLVNPNILKEIGLSISEAQKIYDEAKNVCGGR